MTDEAWWHQSQGDPANAPISCNCRVCKEKHWPVKYDENGNPTEFSDGVNWHRVQKRREGDMIPQSMEHTSWTGHVNHQTFQPGCDICDQRNHASHNNWVSGCLRCAQEYLSSRPLTDWTGSAAYQEHQRTIGSVTADMGISSPLPLDGKSPLPRGPISYGGREVVESATGGKKGIKQARFDLIDQGFLWSLAEVCGFGAGIYGDNNWRKGYDWSLSYAALMRHLSLFLQGEDLDSESGMPHISHVAWHAMVLYVFSTDGLYREYDTRGEQG